MHATPILLPVKIRVARDMLSRALAELETHDVDAAVDHLVQAVTVANQIPRLIAEMNEEES